MNKHLQTPVGIISGTIMWCSLYKLFWYDICPVCSVCHNLNEYQYTRIVNIGMPNPFSKLGNGVM